MTIAIDAVVSPNDDAVFRELDGESLVLNLETGMYFRLAAKGLWTLN